jgi:hypothetical protein
MSYRRNVTEPQAPRKRFFDDERGVAARELMLNEIRNQLGHELFTANSLLDLLAVIEDAAGNMVTTDKLTGEHMQLAVTRTHNLLAQLSVARTESESVFFQEITVATAQSRLLCPGFWPFC